MCLSSHPDQQCKRVIWIKPAKANAPRNPTLQHLQRQQLTQRQRCPSWPHRQRPDQSCLHGHLWHHQTSLLQPNQPFPHHVLQGTRVSCHFLYLQCQLHRVSPNQEPNKTRTPLRLPNHLQVPVKLRIQISPSKDGQQNLKGWWRLHPIPTHYSPIHSSRHPLHQLRWRSYL